MLNLCLIFEYVILYLWCQILTKFDVNQIWLTTWLFVYVLASDHKTDISTKNNCFVGWLVGLDPLQLWMEISYFTFTVSLAYHRISLVGRKHRLSVASDLHFWCGIWLQVRRSPKFLINLQEYWLSSLSIMQIMFSSYFLVQTVFTLSFCSL